MQEEAFIERSTPSQHGPKTASFRYLSLACDVLDSSIMSPLLFAAALLCLGFMLKANGRRTPPTGLSPVTA